jgi:nitroreductase
MIDNAYGVLKCISDRHSLRSFSDKKISESDLQILLKTGLNAASGGNLQPYSIIVEREPARKKRLADLCSNQNFISEADTNLLFILDWYKYSIYAKQCHAPFVANRAYMHFLIAVEDIMCAAQTIETSAHILGIGSCYVGSTNECIDDLIKMYDLPRLTLPVVLLSLGYPKHEVSVNRPKMPYDMMIFNEIYPKMTTQEIANGFDSKYKGQTLQLPQNKEIRKNTLNAFRSALLTTFTADESESIIAEADRQGFINETQRRFGLHYSADEMISEGKEIFEGIKKQGFTYFDQNK